MLTPSLPFVPVRLASQPQQQRGRLVVRAAGFDNLTNALNNAWGKLKVRRTFPLAFTPPPLAHSPLSRCLHCSPGPGRV